MLICFGFCCCLCWLLWGVGTLAIVFLLFLALCSPKSSLLFVSWSSLSAHCNLLWFWFWGLTWCWTELTPGLCSRITPDGAQETLGSAGNWLHSRQVPCVCYSISLALFHHCLSPLTYCCKHKLSLSSLVSFLCILSHSFYLKHGQASSLYSLHPHLISTAFISQVCGSSPSSHLPLFTSRMGIQYFSMVPYLLWLPELDVMPSWES